MKLVDLSSQETFRELSQSTDLAVNYNDIQQANRVIVALEDNLANQQDKVIANPDFYEGYRKMWVKCQFIALASISDEDFFDLIKENLLEGLALPEYDLVEKVETRISFISIDDDKANFVQQLITILENNTALLGTEKITTNGIVRDPTLQYWLADYKNYPVQTAVRTDIEEVSYITKSPNASKLSIPQRNQLLEVLSLYDELQVFLKAYIQETKSEPKMPPASQLYPGAVYVKGSFENDELREEASLSTSTPAQISKKTAEIHSEAEILVPSNVEEDHTESDFIAEPEPAKLEPEIDNLDAEQTSPVEDRLSKSQPVQKFIPAAPKPKLPADSYIVEDKPTPEVVIPPKPSEVEEEIKAKLKQMNIRTSNPPMNIQDFLNQRTKDGGGIVFDRAPKIETPVKKTASQPPVDTAALTSKPQATSKAPLATAPELPVSEPVEIKTGPSADDIAKKLDELRSRKQS